MVDERDRTGLGICAEDVGAAMDGEPPIDAESARLYGSGRARRTITGVGSPMRALREAAGYSRERIGGLAGISRRQVARMEEGAIAQLKVEDLVRVALVLGCAVTDIVPALGERLAVVRGRKDIEGEQKMWRKREPAQMGAEKRSHARRKAVEWLWERVVAQGGRVRADWVRAEYRDEGEPWGPANTALYRARCELGMRLVQEAGKFGWWWETDHRPLVVGELPPLLKISDRVGRRELSSEG